MKKVLKWIIAVLPALWLTACTGGYSFTGGDIGNAQTISIDLFPNYAEYVNPSLSQSFTEGLRDIFVQQTSLSLVSSGGDLQLQGSIVDYRIDAMSATANETTAQNRLTITVNVIYTNLLDDKKNFEQRFSRFRNFPSDQSLNSVESQLVEEINRELAENIFNRAVVNW